MLPNLLTPAAFKTPEDIANRALQYLGADHKITNLLTDGSKEQRQILRVFTQMRDAELRRNNWVFSMKRAIIRALDTTSMEWTPPAWDNATTYRVGQVVSYDDGYGTRLWVNLKANSLNDIPGTAKNWDNYFGTLVAPPYDSTLSYWAGDLVYVTPGDGTYKVYLSINSDNGNDPGTVETYDSTVQYNKGDIVVVSAQNYISLVDLNKGNAPASSPSQWATTVLDDNLKWVQVNGTLATVRVLYPIAAGPSSQITTQNAYMMPYGYLRKGGQDPKAGSFSIYGAPTNLLYDDWLIENGFLVTTMNEPINIRFVGAVTNVAAMDPMFCEGWAARLAMAVCEPLTQSTEKMKEIQQAYGIFMREARIVNGIEDGADEPALDDWISCRI